MIAPSLDIIGGHSILAERLLREFRNRPDLKVDFLPINPRLPGPLRGLQSIPYIRTIVTTGLYLLLLLGKIWRCDVLHIFAAAYSSFLLTPTPAILLARLIGKKIILNYHDGQAEDHLANWRTTLPILRLVDEIAVPSGFLVDVFAKFGFTARCIYNIVDSDRFTFRERNPPQPVFLHNRGMEPLYNIPCTLKAFGLIQERYPEASLTLAHGGPLRGQLEDMAQAMNLRNVRFIGIVSQKDSAAVYNASGIYLNSPNIDNMPLSLLECFAAGVPVVSSNVGGIPYILSDGKTGLLFEKDDHKGMAACVFRLLEEEGLALRLIRSARAECAKYTGKAIAARWIELYENVVYGVSRQEISAP